MLLGIVLIILALLGAPLFAIIAAGALISFTAQDLSQGVVVPIEIFSIAEMPILLAIPLFTFAGYILSESQAPGRLVRLTRAVLGWMPGGLAIVCIGASAFFTAFTGASGVTIIALGAILYPALAQSGYHDKFNLGLVTAGGSLGLLFAPSLPLILYGVVAEVNIDSLFVAGVLPGMLMLAALSVYSLWVNRHTRIPLAHFSWREVGSAIIDSIWELPLPIVVLGGIYSGLLAVSEAAAVTAVYVFLVEVVIRREIPLLKLPDIMRESMVLVGGILLILGASLASTNYVIDAEIPQQLIGVVTEYVDGRISFLFLLLIFLLILGAFLDIFSALVLVVPLILPVAAQFGVEPVHLGMIFLATMQLGYLTPPVGLNLFIASYRFQKSIVTVYLATFPFLLILLAAVLVITFWPGLSLVLLD
ncbi:MAG: TRAP transporter large permease [Gammaproteobacteria bacterium]|jgi:tripartite ATP-independent transporter DctM subunit|nr:TRAP transporter large permease [Gammaproteobacteria bacterium]MDP6616048.1 TRAP transporter large permease [Gammaproteobacteria bacterium]MDP6695477.1 TRAP transporter large permease [Gammaproteobacteria bacterium]